ncbi:hypothetical protein LWI28_000728 [Acer negundo]|uniref:Uncharacterized protein n=1 Tax=Acer negundo TaxID=4023 RepID=A0AAD5P0Q4_ACENE|nr:hypothetical protein LWI28_000728 [Acer negundo]KAK4855973.1 hypothetical protein QYF36_012892 [Acer negundo]
MLTTRGVVGELFFPRQRHEEVERGDKEILGTLQKRCQKTLAAVGRKRTGRDAGSSCSRSEEGADFLDFPRTHIKEKGKERWVAKARPQQGLILDFKNWRGNCSKSGMAMGGKKVVGNRLISSGPVFSKRSSLDDQLKEYLNKIAQAFVRVNYLKSLGSYMEQNEQNNQSPKEVTFEDDSVLVVSESKETSVEDRTGDEQEKISSNSWSISTTKVDGMMEVVPSEMKKKTGKGKKIGNNSSLVQKSHGMKTRHARNRISEGVSVDVSKGVEAVNTNAQLIPVNQDDEVTKILEI